MHGLQVACGQFEHIGGFVGGGVAAAVEEEGGQAVEAEVAGFAEVLVEGAEDGGVGESAVEDGCGHSGGAGFLAHGGGGIWQVDAHDAVVEGPAARVVAGAHEGAGERAVGFRGRVAAGGGFRGFGRLSPGVLEEAGTIAWGVLGEDAQFQEQVIGRAVGKRGEFAVEASADRARGCGEHEQAHRRIRASPGQAADRAEVVDFLVQSVFEEVVADGGEQGSRFDPANGEACAASQSKSTPGGPASESLLPVPALSGPTLHRHQLSSSRLSAT